MAERGPAIGRGIGAPSLGVSRVGGERAAVATLSRPASPFRTGNLELHSVIPQRRPGGILNNLGEVNSSAISQRESRRVFQNITPLSTNVRSERTQTPQTRRLPQTAPFTIDPLIQLAGDTAGRLTPDAVRGLQEFRVPGREDAVRVRPDSVSIVSFPRRIGEARPTETRTEPLAIGGYAPNEQGRLSPVSEFTASANVAAEKRKAEIRQQLQVEDQKQRNDSKPSTSGAAYTTLSHTPVVVEENSALSPTDENRSRFSAAVIRKRMARRESSKAKLHATDDVSASDRMFAHEMSQVKMFVAKLHIFSEGDDAYWQALKTMRKDTLHWGDLGERLSVTLISMRSAIQLALAEVPEGFDLEAILDPLKKKKKRFSPEATKQPEAQIQHAQPVPEQSQPEIDLQPKVASIIGVAPDRKFEMQPVQDTQTEMRADTSIVTGQQVQASVVTTPSLQAFATTASEQATQTQSETEKSVRGQIALLLLSIGENVATKLKYIIHQETKKERAKQIKNGAAKAPATPEGLVRGQDVVVTAEKYSANSKSPLVRAAHGDDGSEVTVWNYIGGLGAMPRNEIEAAATAINEGFHPVALVKEDESGRKADEKDVALVLTDVQREELALAA